MPEEPKEPLSDAISESLGLGAILREARRQDGAEREKGYWILCPSCGRRVVKKEFVKKGCYVCTHKDEENKNEKLPYRVNCPNCGKEVISEELKKKGCFVCGCKPESVHLING